MAGSVGAAAGVSSLSQRLSPGRQGDAAVVPPWIWSRTGPGGLSTEAAWVPWGSTSNPLWDRSEHECHNLTRRPAASTVPWCVWMPPVSQGHSGASLASISPLHLFYCHSERNPFDKLHVRRKSQQTATWRNPGHQAWRRSGGPLDTHGVSCAAQSAHVQTQRHGDLGLRDGTGWANC